MISFAEFKKTRTQPTTSGRLSFAEFKNKPKVETPEITKPIDIRKQPSFSDFKTQTSTSPFISPDTPTIQGVVGNIAKEAGQSTMRNIASFIGSEALEPVVTPITRKVSELEKGSLNFQFFTEDLAKRLYGDVEDLTPVEITGESRAEQLSPIGERIVGLEKRLEEKKKEYDELLKLPDLAKNEKLVLESLSNLIGKQKGGLSTVLIGGMVGLDVVPGFGSADNFLKTLVKETTELGAERTLLKLGISEDLAKFYAPDVVKVKNTKEAQKLYEAIVKSQTSTKPIKSTGFQGYDDLTTKFLDYAKGKTTLSRQEILDFAKRPELKKGEADGLNKLAQDLPDGKVSAQDFADSIRRDLLELKPVKVKEPQYEGVQIDEARYRQGETAGGGKNYEEVVFESPITTNGSSHFPNSKNYFAHARGDEVVEGGKKIWREQEIQSDALQKEGLEKTYGWARNSRTLEEIAQLEKELLAKGQTQSQVNNLLRPDRNAIEAMKSYEKLSPFTNDRFGERIMRERIREKAQKGYSKYRLPTGETIGKIEGFEANQWVLPEKVDKGTYEVFEPVKSDMLKVGLEIQDGNYDNWIITDILGDGRFKAVPKYYVELEVKNNKQLLDKYGDNYARAAKEVNDAFTGRSETFDLTGKSNPQYRRYEQWGKFLKNKYGGKEVVDPQGNKWVEIDLNKDMGKLPVEAFGGVAGLEYDEEGNLKFDPVKGVLGVAGMTFAKKIPTVDELKTLGKKVTELGGKSRSEIKNVIDDLEEQLSFISENIDEMPGKRLQKFISKKEGQFLDLPDPNKAKSVSERQRIIERNRKIMQESEVAFEGTEKSNMYDDPDTIRQAIEEYQEKRDLIRSIQNKATELRQERALLTKAKVASGIGMKQRRMEFRAVMDRYVLTDSEIQKFVRSRNVSAMENDEWRTFLKEVEEYGEKTQLQRDAMAQLGGTIQNKELKSWDNLRQALNLPPVNQMGKEQLENFEKILDQYKTGDEFLPVRMLQTIDNSELKGIKTTREVQEYLAKKTGRQVDNQPIKVTEWHRMLGDRRLARENPFFEVLVERKNRGLLEAEARTIQLSDEVDTLIKQARDSKQRGFLERMLPTDDNIVRWLESDTQTKTTLAKEMTKEELKAAERIDEIFKSYYDYLVKRNAEKKFSRFEGQYFPHVRRGFLEAWKEDGILSAFKEMKAKYEQDAFTMNILNDKTQEILPYEKWIGFSQFRSGNLIPTKNAAKAFDAYVTALEKAKHLDEMIPEMMAYVHTLSPRNFSQHGIELDESLKKFVKEWINANKGRVPKGFFTPGGGFDVFNRSMLALTRMLDLGFNFSTQVAAPVGENLMTLTILKPKAYTQGLLRSQTKQGKEIISKYKEFVGRTPWESVTRASSDIGDKLMSGAFAVYGQATKQANSLFLLGKMTDEEFKTGIISAERLAKLKIEMSKYRSIKGMESILGRTTESEAIKQYKSWAIPPLTATVENAREMASLIRKEGVAKALASDEGKELFYSIGMGSAIGLLTYSKYKELEGKDRSFMEDVAFKAMRDATSIYATFDPQLWSNVRLASFFEDLGEAVNNLITLETYKTTGELKGIKQLENTLTPSVIKRILPDKKEEPDTKKSGNKLQELRNKTKSKSKLQKLRSKTKSKNKLQELRKNRN